MTANTHSKAPNNLGSGRTIDRRITLVDIQALWGCPTQRENVPAIPGAPARVILTYTFPDPRLEGRVIDMSVSGGYRTQRFDVLRLHFETNGSLIFMEQGTKTNLPEAIGGDLEAVRVLPGEGHYLGSRRC